MPQAGGGTHSPSQSQPAKQQGSDMIYVLHSNPAREGRRSPMDKAIQGVCSAPTTEVSAEDPVLCSMVSNLEACYR